MPLRQGNGDEEQIDTRRVLIIRLSAIGDVTFASPLIKSISNLAPNVEVSWLAEGTVAPLLEHHPLLERVIVWPRAEWRQLLRRGRLVALVRSVLKFRQRLRDARFDLVLEVQGLFKSAFLAWMTGAPRRVGFISKEPTGLFLTERIAKDTGDTISSEYRGMARHVGCQADDFPMDIALPPEALARATLHREGGPYVVLAPFTTRPQKHWPEAHWRRLASQMCVRGWRVTVLGAPADSAAAERMFSGVALESMVGVTSLLESAALVAGAALVIGVDTGLTHMGWAFSVPTIALFGSTCPYRELGSLVGEVLYLDLACAPCRRRPVCGGRYDCLTDIEPDYVLSRAEGYLSPTMLAGRVIASVGDARGSN